ncbi:MAG: hypothetical protein EA398_13125 [Deltaproteobacteria bacterium]|nr:MAG: hypothetical protein EA398_13125 [Deltaproteobacteria bacterium]
MTTRPRLSPTGFATAVACFFLAACSAAPEELLPREESPPLPARETEAASVPERPLLDGESRALPALRTVGHFEGWVHPLTGEAHVSMVHPGQKSAAQPGFRDDLRQNRDDGDFESVRGGTLRFQQDESGNGSDDEECQAFWLDGWAPDWRFGYIPASMPAAREAFFTLLSTGGPGSAEVSGGNRFCTNFRVRNDKPDEVRDLWILIDQFSLSGVRSYVDVAPRTVEIGPGEFETLEPYSPIGMFNYGRLEPGEVANRQWYFYLGTIDPQPFRLQGRLVELLREDCTTETDDNNDGVVNSGCRQFDLGDACIIDDDCTSLWCNPDTDQCDQFDCDPGDGCVAPVVETDPPTGVTGSSASLRGTLVERGEPPVVARGFCHGDVPTPAHGVDGVTCTQVGGEQPLAGMYNLLLDDLDPGQRVRYVAWAQGLDMMRYGGVEEFVIAPSPVTTLSVINVTHEGAELTWDLADGATGYRIYRDGVFIEEVSGTTWAVQGLAPPPTAEPTGLTATTDRQGEVRLSWDEPDEPQTGPIRDFGVRSVAHDVPSELGAVNVSVARAAYTLDGFRIERNIGGDVEIFIVDVGETTFDDDTAPAPTLLAPTALDATDGTAFERVEIEVNIPRPEPGEPADYRISQLYAEELASAYGEPVAGQRDVEELFATLFRGESPGDLQNVILNLTEEVGAFESGPLVWLVEDIDATPVLPPRHYTAVVEADGLAAVQSPSTTGFPGAIPEVTLDTAQITGQTTAILDGAHANLAPEPAEVRACWRLQGDPSFTCAAPAVRPPGPVSVPLTDLPAGRNLDFQLRSSTMHGEGLSNLRSGLTPPSAPASFLASQGGSHAHVALTWQHNPGQVVDSYRIYRDGDLLDTVPGTSTSYDDGGAPAGTVSSPTVLQTFGSATRITVTWNNPNPQSGASRTYQVVAVNGSGSAESPERTGWRAAPTITAIELDTSDDILNLGGPPLAEMYLDSDAPAPTINAGTLTASEGTSSEHIALEASGFATSPGDPRTYRVRVLTNTGDGPWSSSSTASRVAGPLQYRFLQFMGGTSFQQVRGWGSSNTFNDTDAPVDETPQTYVAEIQASGVSGVVTSNLATGFRAEPERWVSIASNASASCGIRSSGRLHCWGSGQDGMLGNGDTDNRDTPTEVAGGHTDWISVSGGQRQFCGLRGNGQAYCWGNNQYGQLGVGNTTNVVVPTPVRNAEFNDPPFSDVVTVSSGTTSACLIRSNGNLYCWGWTSDGGIGNGNCGGSIRSYPLQITNPSLSWRDVSMGWRGGCAISTADRLYCWGYNLYGANGTALNATCDNGGIPREVDGGGTWLTVDRSANGHHTCGVRANGSTHCWGRNHHGQIGRGTLGGNCCGSNNGHNSPQPVLNLGSGTTERVMVGTNHTCAARTNGALRCWGNNEDGQIGNGSMGGDFTSPQAVTAGLGTTSANRFFQGVGGGLATQCIVEGDTADTLVGRLWCWGSNADGGLGRGPASSDPTPVEVSDP